MLLNLGSTSRYTHGLYSVLPSFVESVSIVKRVIAFLIR